MRYWLMFMTVGKGGADVFPDCKQRGIAALDYCWGNGLKKRIVGDCRKLSEREYKDLWRSRARRNGTGNISLRRLWKEMKVGDVIYAKTIPWIVGKGSIIGEYEFDSNILNGTTGAKWGHFVRVAWKNDFIKFKFSSPSRKHTISEIINPDLKKLLKAERAAGA